MTEEILFEEKQFLAYNKYSTFLRMVMALFCFAAYYWSENPKPVDISVFHIGAYPGQDYNGSLFFWMGIVILLLSSSLIFVKHLHTTVFSSHLTIDGIWTTRKVKINLGTIVKIEKVNYSKYFLNRPVYNLHSNGTIHFYTHGNQAIELTDRDGLKYRIGTQRVNEIYDAISKRISSAS